MHNYIEKGKELKSKLAKIIPLLVSASLLSACIPSGNIVGKANFTTISSTFANQGDVAQISVNGGIVATPKGIQLRITKANFVVGNINVSAAKFKEVIPVDITKQTFIDSRLKGKNVCGWIGGISTEGYEFTMILLNPGSGIGNLNEIPQDSQILVIESTVGEWVGIAPVNSLKIGGRNLCNNLQIG